MHLPQVSSVRMEKVTVGELAAAREALEPCVMEIQVKGCADASGKVRAMKMKISTLL